MKHTVFGFSQQLIVDQGLNLSDAAVLRFIVDFYHTGKMKKMIIGGKEYIWVSYKYVSESLPIIHVGFKSNSDRAMKKRVTDCIDHLASAGAIEKMIQKDSQGTFVFVRIIEDMYNHYIAGVTTGKVTGYHHEGNGVTTGKVTKDSSINDSSIKIKKTKEKKESPVEYPPWLIVPAFEEFLQDRKNRNIKTTNLAIKKLVTALEKACDGNYHLQEQIINKSIANSWQSFFPLRINEKPKQQMIVPEYL